MLFYVEINMINDKMRLFVHCVVHVYALRNTVEHVICLFSATKMLKCLFKHSLKVCLKSRKKNEEMLFRQMQNIFILSQ